MNFTKLDADQQEYCIHRPDTPRPWRNYLGSDEFGGVITNNAAEIEGASAQKEMADTVSRTAATWNYVAMVQGILGIRSVEDELEIDPSIPSSWEGFTAKRCFCGRTIHIRVENPNGQCKSVNRLQVDGVWVSGNRVHLSEAGSEEILVRAVLGS
jgi:cellobiose phosphorylase